MSSFQDKMYNHEETPPVNSWEKIAAALDNSPTQNGFSSRLYNIEINPPVTTWEKIVTAIDYVHPQNEFSSLLYNIKVNPPANTWEKIVAAIDNAQTQNEFSSRLYNIEVNPPANTWKKIAATLDEPRIQNEFPSRLYNMEVAPPVNVWEKVVAGLNKTSVIVNTPVRKFSAILRYAAAAIFIGAVAYGIINLTVNTGNDVNNTVVSKINKDSSTSEINKAGDTGKIQTPEITNSENDAGAIEKSKPLFAKHVRPVKRVSRAIISSMIASNDADIATADLSQSLYAYADHIPDIADRYVMLMTPDGNIIRMSKKWGHLLCCVSGEEQDADCKSQLKKWQEKIATSSLAPSPGNFMDILGLVNSLNEDNGL